MKRHSQQTSRLVLLVLASITAVLFTFTVVRGQSLPPTTTTKKVLPQLPLAALSSVRTPKVPGIENYIANEQAVVKLGKVLFWDMQVGSDGVQACATCHFNAGADSRTNNQVDPDIRGGNSTFQMGVFIGGNIYPNYQLYAGTPGAGFGGYHDGDFPLHKQGNVDNRNNVISDDYDVISSQGVFSSNFDSIQLGSGIDQQTVTSDSIFSYPDPADPSGTKLINTRRVEPRNTPTVVNAVFNYRNFWDGRARNICNGANPFGERDTNSHFFQSSRLERMPEAKLVRLENSALCSQALGPPMSNFEMSAQGRNFRELGQKLLAVSPLQSQGATTPLGMQVIDPTDSVLGVHSRSPHKGINLSYTSMIEQAFHPKWWQSRWHICIAADGSETLIDPAKKGASCAAGAKEYTQMQYNFSLFWGIAIQMYESTLRADKTPVDQYLASQSAFAIPANNTTNSFNFTLGTGNITPSTVSVMSFNPALDASDQDVFAFDDGAGNIVGPGVTSGTIDYVSGVVSIFFDLPPTTGVPTNVGYSTGKTPLTQAQLHGLTLFQTKARCIVCHGGPELSNAAVSNVSQRPLERMIMGDGTIRVYDDGFYHIGVRPGHEDIGIADVDGIPGSGLPLSEAANQQRLVCAGGPAPIIPGRPGDGISAQPLSCSDIISNYGMEKAPMLRNISLTAPYFHNGGQLTLEQVVEFYNRGGDFPDGFSEIPLMDPNIVQLQLTDQEKTDLVDFLRNALTDQRTVRQAAPFDHPSLFVPNGHPIDANGYPLPDPNHPGQAMDQYMTIPAVGRRGGAPLPTFLDNLEKQ